MNIEDCRLRRIIQRRFENKEGIAHVSAVWNDKDIADCPLCGGLKFIEKKNDQGYRVVYPCPGTWLLQNIEKYNRSHIPARFMDDTLDNYDINLIKNPARVQHFIDSIKNFEKEPCGYILEGGPGCGKTHLLCAAIRYLTLELGKSCMYVDYSALLSSIRASYTQNIPESNYIDPLTAAPILFIDELGKGREKANDFEIRIIDDIINKRYMNPDLTTFFASNYFDRDTSGYNKYIKNGYNIWSSAPMSSIQWMEFARSSWRKEGFSSQEDFTSCVRAVMNRDHIEDRVSERTASRILVMARTMHIDAGDYRLSVQRIERQ